MTKKHRCYVHETTVKLLFGSQPGIGLPQDTSRLLEAARSSAVPFCLIALFSYIMVPLMGIPFLKNLLVPRSEDKHGFGQMMAVSIFYGNRRVRKLNGARSIVTILCVFLRRIPSIQSTLGNCLRSHMLRSPLTNSAVFVDDEIPSLR